ncbi:hypothetical protein P5673_000122 [Acropora cervicornis]|uniref:Uncharacterized protein n=1 Tax=Acropora cervicornis TaxID=6130 RepID=A0AAD9VGS6_ACRCE|nr:hypothetical protein P5673_000122 [Acropora cervicornis]
MAASKRPIHQRLIQRADYINARLRRLQRQDPTTNDDACERETNNGSMQIESTDNKGTIDRPREGREIVLTNTVRGALCSQKVVPCSPTARFLNPGSIREDQRNFNSGWG